MRNKHLSLVPGQGWLATVTYNGKDVSTYRVLAWTIEGPMITDGVGAVEVLDGSRHYRTYAVWHPEDEAGNVPTPPEDVVELVLEEHLRMKEYFMKTREEERRE